MLRNISISGRLGAAFGLLLTLLIGLALLAGVDSGRLLGVTEQFEQRVSPSATAVFQFSNAIKDLRRLESQTILWVPDAGELKDLGIDASMQKAQIQAEEALQQYEKLAVDDDERRNLAELKGLLATYASARAEVVNTAMGADQDATKSLQAKKMMWYGPSRKAFGALSKSFDEWRVRASEAGLKAAADAKASYRQARLLRLGFVALALSVGVAAAWVIARSITVPLAQAVTVAEAVASGDLRSRISVTGSDETAQLLQALQTMNRQLVGMVGQVRESSDHIATGSTEIAHGNADLSRRTEMQASHLQQTAASMDQLTRTVRHSTETARQATQLATTAAAAATQGGVAVGQVVSTMQEIAQSSKHIADITGVIEGIAFQTNILALNAAVEAARAGEQGRGFAVVASEVRSLAQRSSEAAKQIKSLLGASVERVDLGNRLVDDARVSMDDIVGQVRRVSELIAEIATATGAQSIGIGQVGDAVGQLDQTTQQNAALVEQSAAAAESLKRQADRLTAAVGNFRVAPASPDRA